VKTIYWHRELPPLDGEVMGEHVVEATSNRVSGAIDHQGELWHQTYSTLMDHARIRLEQEIPRLGGHFAHVLDEHIESHRNDATDESWLHGRFNYVLFRRTS
jgi:hypothetical protein